MPLRRRRSPQDAGHPPEPLVDPGDVGPHWRPAVLRALDARDRFGRIVARVAAGPVRDRLVALSARIDAGVVAAQHLALRAQAHQATLEDLRPEALTARVKDARRAVTAAEKAGVDAGAQRATLEALLTQLASTMRVWDAVDDCRSRLASLNDRLDEAVVHAAAVATSGAVDDPALLLVEAELTTAGEELAALGEALDSIGPG